MHVGYFVCLGLFYPLYDQNNSNPHCAIHESVTSVTIILTGLTATFSVIRGDGSFGVAAMVCFYSTFLLFESMQSDPDGAEGHKSCNLFHRARDGLSLWLGFFITFASLFYAAFRSDTMAVLGKDPKFVIGNGDVEMDESDNKIVSLLTTKDKKEAIAMDENESNYDDVDDDGKKGLNDEENEDEESKESKDRKANLYFHIVMMLAAAYMSMLFTNWGTNKDSIDTVGTISFIVGVCSSWTALLMYWWTLCAPAICPHRFPGNVEE